MNAYYYGFDETGVREVDLILSSVASAGKSYHHTRDWTEPGWNDGPSCVEEIQQAADAAAAEVRRLCAAVDDVLALHRVNTGMCLHCAASYPCATAGALAPVADPDPHTTSEKETSVPERVYYEVISLYDSRIIRRDLNEQEAHDLVKDLNRRTDHGARMQRQRYGKALR
jgi:hypothetical protein